MTYTRKRKPIPGDFSAMAHGQWVAIAISASEVISDGDDKTMCVLLSCGRVRVAMCYTAALW